MRFLLGLIIGATATVLLAPRVFELTGLPESATTRESTAAGSLERSVGHVLQAVAARARTTVGEPYGESDNGPTQSPADPSVDPELPQAEYTRDRLPLPEIAATPTHDATTFEIAHPPPPGPILTELSQEQAVWVPFRAESSARGFAAKLSERLNRPFQVLRAGPGQYLVVFGYRDEAERADVLDQIKTLTGYVQI